MLSIQNLAAKYGASQALFNVDLEVGAGQVVGLIGRNGMGRTTVIKCLFGLLPVVGGTIQFDNQRLNGLASYRIGRMGISLVPEGRQIFPTLSVEENLIATASRSAAHGQWTLERIYKFFPRLQERRQNLGTQLSGGEQQMLAIGRALMTNPRLLVLDEATEGLAPIVRAEIWKVLQELKNEGLSMIVIDKNTKALLRLADYNFILDKGVTVWRGSSPELAARPDLVDRYVGV
ncbi:ABC transporter ATP-binding protein [Eoetvoesiella caeni]|uniref:Amino acid/amide ABC transporter ATP-binding protein 2 (HAAT family) n=1 Tax=Eoetvoesiella caeni TaxID=645616 RepID=A0A366HAZ9_9BURK|nr:ABC transporter ATP-binding protein [Eoetvoesiella caeni]MCI2809645.1 ABC transporter ATP-binding protein [Eoetvoesiella caeni]NYT56141.1 ABC transporter ATP-binding protein [Eoetvoesiella caeni]RBP38906.1 amino acid/amide ABC transporter ATP-binding protein 2 (HAAT family) [Eoetvoesiella caeni]